MRWRSFMVSAVLATAVVLPAAPAVAVGGQAYVRSSVGLNVRSGPDLGHRILSRLPHRARVAVACQVTGQQIAGTQRTTTRWNKLASGGYVSDAFLAWSASSAKVPSCGDGGRPAARVAVAWPLNIRSGPSLAHRVVGRLAPGAKAPATCRAWGQSIEGDPVWYAIGRAQYVTQRFLRWTPSQPWLRWCGQAPAEIPAATNAAFIARVAPGAQSSMRKYRIPASVTIAQAILESGWGRSTLTTQDHNYFGMKCFGSPGGIAVGCSAYATRECDGSRCFGIRDSFRAYRTAADSFADHGKQLATLPRYRTAMRWTASPDRFAVEIHKAGYATSPAYAQTLIAIMKQFRLSRYDR